MPSGGPKCYVAARLYRTRSSLYAYGKSIAPLCHEVNEEIKPSSSTAVHLDHFFRGSRHKWLYYAIDEKSWLNRTDIICPHVCVMKVENIYFLFNDKQRKCNTNKYLGRQEYFMFPVLLSGAFPFISIKISILNVISTHLTWSFKFLLDKI